jgi:hypothetical protein
VKNRGLLALKAPPKNVGLTKYIRLLFIDKTKVLPGHVGALNRMECA